MDEELGETLARVELLLRNAQAAAYQGYAEQLKSADHQIEQLEKKLAEARNKLMKAESELSAIRQILRGGEIA